MQQNFAKPISLADVAKLVHMTEPAFSRFFKQRAGINFIDSLTEIRLGHATRLLIDTTLSIGEIAHQCGFNNISNFNRTFKKKKNITPKDYRDYYTTSTGIYI
jgi:transcriptional regulator GlxA family with amidase domain